MRQLIITADDLGRDAAMDAGIAAAVEAGRVSAVSVMSNGATVEAGVAAVRAAGRAELGLHLVWVQGRPLAPIRAIPSLVAPSGEFWPSVFSLARRRVRAAELLVEAEAQLARFMQLVGTAPTFVNTHQHAQAHPVVLGAMLELCRRYRIRAARLSADLWPFPNRRLRSLAWPAVSAFGVAQRRRYVAAKVRHPRGMLGGPASERLTSARLQRLLARVAEGTTELVVHPSAGSSDAEALASPAVARILETRAIRRVGFDVL